MFSLLSGLLASAVAPPLQPRDLHRPRPASSCRCSLLGLGAVGLLCGIALLLSGRSPLDGPPGWLAPTATVPACATLRACMAALAGAAPAKRGGAAPGERGGAAPTELGDGGQAVAPNLSAARRPPAEALSAEAHRGVLREATAWATAEVPLPIPLRLRLRLPLPLRLRLPLPLPVPVPLPLPYTRSARACGVQPAAPRGDGGGHGRCPVRRAADALQGHGRDLARAVRDEPGARAVHPTRTLTLTLDLTLITLTLTLTLTLALALILGAYPTKL